MTPDHDDCAGKLTQCARYRRVSGAGRTLLAALVLAGLSTGASAATAADRQPVADIRAAAENYLRQRLRNAERKLSFQAGSLDPRLRLPLCDAALEAFPAQTGRVGTRTAVGVRCSGTRPWKIYVPVDVVETRPVVVARRALARGHVLAPADLAVEKRDVSRMVGGYVSAPEAVVGQRLKRRLVSGSHLAPSMLEMEPAVRRGQSVTLVVRSGSLNIRMTGKALMDGAIDQRIRVTNVSSQRTVEGLVRSPELVEVLTR